MILWLTTMVATAKTDTLVTHLESRSYRQNGKILVISKDKVLLSRLDGTTIPHEALPKLGDMNKELGRLQNKYGTTCVLEIAPHSEDSDSPVPGVYITELGTCTMDENIRYSIKDNGKFWTVVDNEGDEVSVQAFANVCEDIPLLLRLEHEKKVSRRNGKALEWGATGLAIGGVFTMGNPDPGFSAREQNRFWTSVFLFGTAAILYTQRDIPFVYMTDSQNSLANYHSRESVERILLQTFGLPLEDNSETETAMPSEESSGTEIGSNVSTSEISDISDDAQETKTLPENGEPAPTVPPTGQAIDTESEPPASSEEEQ